MSLTDSESEQGVEKHSKADQNNNDIELLIENKIKAALNKLSQPDPSPKKRKIEEHQGDEQQECLDGEGQDEEDWLTDEEDEETSAPITQVIADYIESKLTKRLPKNKLTAKIDRQKRPQNIKVPKK